MKTILIFQNGELIRQISYKTKFLAMKNYNIFLHFGYLDFRTGEKLNNLTFELI